MSCCAAVFAVAHVGSTQDTDERNAHVNQVSTFLTAAANAGHAHRVMPHIAPWVAHSHTGVRSLAVQALHSVAKTTKHSSQSVASTVTHERRLADIKSTEDAGLVLARLIADRNMDLATRVAALEGFHSWRSMKTEALDTLQQALLVELEVRRCAQYWGCSAAPDFTSPLNTCLLAWVRHPIHATAKRLAPMKSAPSSKPPTWPLVASTAPPAAISTSASLACWLASCPSTAMWTRSGCCTTLALGHNQTRSDQLALKTGMCRTLQPTTMAVAQQSHHEHVCTHSHDHRHPSARRLSVKSLTLLDIQLGRKQDWSQTWGSDKGGANARISLHDTVHARVGLFDVLFQAEAINVANFQGYLMGQTFSILDAGASLSMGFRKCCLFAASCCMLATSLLTCVHQYCFH